MGQNTKGFLIFIAVLALLLVLGDIFLWINITNQYYDPDALRKEYLNAYPSQVRNLEGLIVLPLILLVFASLIFIRSAKTNLIKVAAATIATVLALAIIWKMYYLM